MMRLRLLTSALSLGAALVMPAVAAEPIIGRASVIDGDTIEISGKRIRLHGVDAPESWQTCEDGDGGTYGCGKEAAFALERFCRLPALPVATPLSAIGMGGS